MRWNEVEAGVGRRAAWAAVAASAVGVAAVATGLGPGAGHRTLAALIASWMFFSGIATGAAAFRAFFRIVDARWARPLAILGGLQSGFLPVAALVLVVILTRTSAAPWIASTSGWLNPRAFVGRELTLNAALFALAYFWLRPRNGQEGAPSRGMAIAYCIVYAVVLSVWAFDFVVGPDPVWGSTLIGTSVLMGAFIAGSATVTLLGVALRVLAPEERRDAGTLVFALAIFWAYLFWSQLLTMWYANIPDEIGFGLRRAMDGWGWVAVAVIGLVFVVPFVALIHPAGRRSSSSLGAVMVAQLVGLWLNCHLLVVPSLLPRGAPPISLRDVLIALGMLGAFALSVAPGIARGLARSRPLETPKPAAACMETSVGAALSDPR